MDYNEIEKLIKLVEKSSLKEFYLKTDDEEIRLVRLDAGQAVAVIPAAAPIAAPAANTVPAPQAEEAAAPSGYVGVHTPYVGTISMKGEDGKPYVNLQDTVAKGQLLCKIEAMKMFSDIVSPVSGIVRKILVKDGDMAEFDAVLFEIEEQA